MKTIGVLGGSFDPIHLGHIDIAKQLMGRYDFAEILFVPAFQNPLKTGPRASAKERAQLIETAIADANEKRFRLFDWETKQAGPSFTVDTLEHLHNTKGDLALLVGDDVFADFPKWKSPHKIFSIASVVVFSRTRKAHNPCPEVMKTLGIEVKWVGNRATFPRGNFVEWCPLETLPFSSTEIRAQLLAQQPTPGLSSSSLRFIKEHKLYAE